MSKTTIFFTPGKSSDAGKRSKVCSNSDNDNRDHMRDEDDEPPAKRSLKSTSSEATEERCASSQKSSVISEDVYRIINDVFTERKCCTTITTAAKEIALVLEQTKNKGCQVRKTSSNTSRCSKQTYIVKRQVSHGLCVC